MTREKRMVDIRLVNCGFLGGGWRSMGFLIFRVLIIFLKLNLEIRGNLKGALWRNPERL